jgi:hypothetical protein
MCIKIVLTCPPLLLKTEGRRHRRERERERERGEREREKFIDNQIDGGARGKEGLF